MVWFLLLVIVFPESLEWYLEFLELLVMASVDSVKVKLLELEV